MTESWNRGDYQISTDRSRLNADLIHDFLSNTAYWATGRSKDVVQRSIENSLCFGIYKNSDQVGFARVVTDYAVCVAGTPWPRTVKVADGSNDRASTATGISPLGLVHKRRVRSVRAVWFYQAAPAGALDGTPRSEHERESGLLEEVA